MIFYVYILDRYLASGNSMISMSFQYLIDLSKWNVVSEIISTMCKVIWDQLYSLILLPTIDEQEWKCIAQDF